MKVPKGMIVILLTNMTQFNQTTELWLLCHDQIALIPQKQLNNQGSPNIQTLSTLTLFLSLQVHGVCCPIYFFAELSWK